MTNSLPLKIRVIHLACISAIGITEPIACTCPTMAKVGWDKFSGNAYLYNSASLSLRFSTDSSSILYW